MQGRIEVRVGNSYTALIEIQRDGVPLDLDGCLLEVVVKRLAGDVAPASLPVLLRVRSGEGITHLPQRGQALLHIDRTATPVFDPSQLYGFETTLTDGGGNRYTPDGLFGRFVPLPSLGS